MAQEPNELSGSRTEPGNGDRDPDALLADIRRTRADMSATVGQVRTRLDPDKLKNQATGQVRDVTDQMRDVTMEHAKHIAENVSMKAKEYTRSLAHQIKDNPVPAAMTMVGLGWLMWKSREKEPDEHDYGYLVSDQGLRTDYPEHMETGPSPCGIGGVGGQELSAQERTGAYESHGAKTGGLSGEEIMRRGQEYARQAGHKAREMRQRAGDKAQEVRQRLRELGELGESTREYRERISHKAHEYGDSAKRYYSTGRERARHAGHDLQRRFERNPMGLGLAAAALGALVGLMVAERRWEHRAMGRQRDNLLAQAKQAGKERLEEARERLHEVKDSLA